MILIIENVLTAEELDIITAKLQDAEFVDGKLTAGWFAKTVKNNTQLSSSAEVGQDLRTIVVKALRRNRLFESAVKPKVIRPIIFSSYSQGMYYGSHTDNAIMGLENPIRSDVSFTLFLNSPLSYKGGELVIDTSLGEQAFKLEAGSAIVYPSTTLHRVETVVEGKRLAAVSWVQSFVREPSEREILFELDTAKQIIFQKYGKTPEFDLISKSYANLLRKWAEV
ncbi:Fe2+-dependent dioxygenase [Plectonema cf. radiosum LEGE 06105]|uniref:Fe2+-dependent dioxygenase n=1 Tax=Plectonema cf. radiosum LEGE 06105 TaxID=945769 RepID=A0A8J7FLR4_9CYAN|nr:Fe2+-dependent dioxygenase [Plectonema radiosum]MBE9215801.1 Fe2+-dependent dioxygenase [Plectonema cf. radiosum LEGE 06105]